MSEEGEGVGKGLMLNDSMQVLTALTERIQVIYMIMCIAIFCSCVGKFDTQHPAGHVIHSAGVSHHGNFGCGVASLVCLAALWSRKISDLEKQVKPMDRIGCFDAMYVVLLVD